MRKERSFKLSEWIPAGILLFSIPFVAIYYYRFEFIWSKQAASNACLLLALIAAIPLLSRRSLKDIFSADFTFFLVLAFWAALSATWARVPTKVFKLGMMLDATVIAYGLARIVFNGERDKRKVILFLLVSLATGLFISVYGILQYHIDSGFFAMPKDQYGAKDPVTTYGLSNFTVDVLVVILPMALAIIATNVNKALKIASGIAAFLIVYYILVSRVRAGYMAIITMTLFVSGAIAFANRKFIVRNIRAIAAGIGALIVAGTLFFGFTSTGKSYVYTFLSSFNLRHSSVQIRIHAWRQALDIIRDHFGIGVGLANYEVFSWKYQDEVQEKMTLESNTRVDKTHNEFLNIFADLGIVGLILFLATFITLGVKTLSFMKRHADTDDFWIAATLGAAVVGELTDALFTFPFQMPGSIHQFFLTLGVLSAFVNEGDFVTRFFERTQGAWQGILKYVGLAFTVPLLILAIIWNINFTQSEIYYRIGQLLKKQGRLQDALLFFEKGLQYEPFAERIYYDRSFVLAKLGRPREAAESMRHCLEQVPYFGKARKEYAMFLSDSGEIDEAIRQFREAMPTHMYAAGEIELYLASLYLKKKNPQMALDEVLKAMRYGVRNANALSVLGNALFPLGKVGLAGSVLRQAVLISGKSYESVASYALYLLRIGKSKEALNVIKESEENLSREPRYWLVRAIIEARAGFKDKARKSVDRLLSIQPAMRARVQANPELKELLK